ncbi:hypothetical protein AUG19_09365 [archaeon 13_1_20CM_2_54_9]|nr:MAG: hypothetical protein AUJ07_08375 [Crenarchaeota archaeon 13_1_40CM_3_53_5]OLE74313.1 MAG: hypothetical protein AUG19_09365 [archaeon 13_1_20CM_2_54_9]
MESAIPLQSADFREDSGYEGEFVLLTLLLTRTRGSVSAVSAAPLESSLHGVKTGTYLPVFHPSNQFAGHQ